MILEQTPRSKTRPEWDYFSSPLARLLALDAACLPPGRHRDWLEAAASLAESTGGRCPPAVVAELFADTPTARGAGVRA